MNNCLSFLCHSQTAEKFLEEENGQNYPILLLNLVGKEELDSTIRVAGAIAFKNFVKRNWNAHAVSKTKRFCYYVWGATNAIVCSLINTKTMLCFVHSIGYRRPESHS